MLSRFGIDVVFLTLSVWKSWIEAAFPEVIVDLIHASRTALSYLSRCRLRMRLCGRTRGVCGRVCALLGCLLDLWHLCVRAADFAVNAHRRLHLHRVGHMAVDVKGGRAETWPMVADKVLTSIPFSSAMVAKVWRRSWKRISGSSAFFRTPSFDHRLSRDRGVARACRDSGRSARCMNFSSAPEAFLPCSAAEGSFAYRFRSWCRPKSALRHSLQALFATLEVSRLFV